MTAGSSSWAPMDWQSSSEAVADLQSCSGSGRPTVESVARASRAVGVEDEMLMDCEMIEGTAVTTRASARVELVTGFVAGEPVAIARRRDGRDQRTVWLAVASAPDRAGVTAALDGNSCGPRELYRLLGEIMPAGTPAPAIVWDDDLLRALERAVASGYRIREWICRLALGESGAADRLAAEASRARISDELPRTASEALIVVAEWVSP